MRASPECPARRSGPHLYRSNGAGGADAIVIQENAEQRQGEVLISEAACSGTFIRRKGQDFSGGDVLLRAGRRLSPRDIGLVASMNLAWLPVRRKPRVALLATGDELAPGEAIDMTGSSAPGSLSPHLSELRRRADCARYCPGQRELARGDAATGARRRPADHHRRRVGGRF